MSDVLIARQGVGNIRYDDQGDGTFAEVVQGGASGVLAGTDIRITQWPSGVVVRYRDMGDGTWAEVVQIED